MVNHNSYISKAHLKNSSNIKLKRPNWIRVKAKKPRLRKNTIQKQS